MYSLDLQVVKRNIMHVLVVSILEVVVSYPDPLQPLSRIEGDLGTRLQFHQLFQALIKLFQARMLSTYTIAKILIKSPWFDE